MVAVLSGASFGQSIPHVVELDAAAREKAGIEMQRDAKQKKVVVVTWGEVRIPLARPVSACAAALVGKGEELVVLAGGVRSSLDLYLVQKDGEFERYDTDGGRRLVRSFNDGAGSWPAVEGRHLLLFAYEKGVGIEFRAMDFRGQVFIARTLPSNVSGWQVDSDPDGGEVRVTFGASAKALTFRHPLAPRLELRSGLLQFGKVDVGKRSRQMLELMNRGKRSLRLRITAPSTGFEIVTKPPEILAAGKSVRLRIDFVPTRAGAYTVPLKIFATGVVPEHIVRLRGEGVALGAPPKMIQPTAKPVGKPITPVIQSVEFYPRGDGAVLVLGRLRIPSTSAAVLRDSGGGETRVRVDAQGQFEARVVAQGAAQLCAVTATKQRSVFVTLGTLPRMLTIEGKAAHIRCLPTEEFVLTARTDGDVLRRWRGTTDSKGYRRLPLSILGKPTRGTDEVPPLTLEVTIVVDGEVRSSVRVRVD